ncbi:MAG: YhbY family RNA-binding protein [Thermoplasmatota archaeon]
MNPLTSSQMAAKRAEGQKLTVTLHVGKSGIGESVIAELKEQLENRKLVKARLLPSATDGGGAAGAKEQARAMAEGAGCILVDVRGHTAVFYKP